MIRPLNHFYPEEDIIDGFSILCFDEFKDLKKFSNSLSSEIRNVVFSNIAKKIVPTLISKNIIGTKKAMESKLEQKISVTPSRVTAQRKSKPDMNTLSMCKKRRFQKQKSTKRLDTESTDVSHITVDVIDVDTQNSKRTNDAVVLLERCNSMERNDEDLTDKIKYAEGYTKNTVISDKDVTDEIGNRKDVCQIVDVVCKRVQNEEIYIFDEYNDSEKGCNDFSPKDTFIDRPDTNADEEILDIAQIDKDIEEKCKNVDHRNKDIDKEFSNNHHLSRDRDSECVAVENPRVQNEWNGGKESDDEDKHTSLDEKCESINEKDQRCCSQRNEDCLINCESVIFEGTAIHHSPVPATSVKPSYLVLLDLESDDSNFPMRINIDEHLVTLCNRVPPDDSDNIDVEKDNPIIGTGEDEDECVIISVGFDPDPKLNNIPIPIPTMFAQNVPCLKPAPTSFFNPNMLSETFKTIHYPPKTSDNQPPPLIPAPAEYFSNFQSGKKYGAEKSRDVSCPKYQSRKRNQMSSPILRPPSKCLKLSPTSVPIQSKAISNLCNDVQKYFIKPLLENNYLPSRKTCSLPTSTIKRAPSLTSITSVNHHQNNILKAVHHDIRLPKPSDTDDTSSKPLQRTVNGSALCFIRKTMCHVHIAQSIHKRHITEHLIDNNSFNYLIGLVRPRAMRYIAPSLSSCPSFPSFNLSRKISMNSSVSPPSLHSISQPVGYPRTYGLSVNAVTSKIDPNIPIKPLHRTPFPSSAHISQFPTSVNNIIPRQNVLLLKQ